MKWYVKHFTLSMCLLLSSTLLSITESKKPWTFLVYMAADNSLSSFGPLDINEMKKVGTNKNANVLVYNNANTPSTGKVTQKLVIYPNNVVQDGPNMSKDSGAENTLLEAVTWAVTQFPSDHIAIIFWDHGAGPLNRSLLYPMRGVCYDDTTGNYLTDLNIQHVLNTVMSSYRNGKKFDIVGFDACLMAGIEIASSLEPYANYMVASQETIPGYGYEYSKILSPFSSGTLDPLTFAKHMVTVYGQAYTGTSGYTLSATNLSAYNNLLAAHTNVCNLLLSFSKKSRYVATTINKAAVATVRFEETTYMDLYQFYGLLSKNITNMKLNSADSKTLTTALTNCQKALTSCIINNVHSTDRAQAHGLSIYYPNYKYIESSYYQLYWAQHSNWIPVLKLVAS